MINKSLDYINQHIGQKIGVDIRAIASGGFYLTLIQITSAIISFFLTIAFARLVPVETYGLYKYILSAYGLLSIASLPGIDTAVIQSISKGNDSSLMRGFSIKLRWGFIGTLISFCIAFYYSFIGQNTVMAGLFTIAGIALPFLESSSLYTASLNAKKLYKTWAVTEFINQLVSAGSLFVTMYFCKNIFFLVIAYFLPYILVRMIVLAYIERRHSITSKDDTELVKYGNSLTVFQIMSRGISYIDSIVLFHLLGPVQVALFSLANAIPNRVQSIYKISGTLTMPKYASLDSKKIASELPKKMLVFGLMILCCGLAYVFIAPFFFRYIIPNYLPSLKYSQVLIFYTLSAITYPFSSMLYAHKKISENYIMSVVAFIIKIVVLLATVPFFGIWGAVWSTLATSISSIVISFYLLRKMKGQ